MTTDSTFLTEGDESPAELSPAEAKARAFYSNTYGEKPQADVPANVRAERDAQPERAMYKPTSLYNIPAAPAPLDATAEERGQLEAQHGELLSVYADLQLNGNEANEVHALVMQHTAAPA